MRKINWLFLMLLSFSFLACDKDDDVALDTTDPTITILSPAAGTTYAPGDAVNLQAEIRDNMGLEEVRVSVTDPSGVERQITDQGISDFLNDNREKDLDVEIALDANAPNGAYIIRVTAIDEQENEASQAVTVSVVQ
ncbi:DUF4625 domain-containing protein [Pontibacter pamirensis]|uniref:DUF4625 domain-containing protein n=1 Tax=Pontibacter pamirensis TaxID=2562824 RepID=UPI0013898D0E|nr:DUF4625 domain-containing protein [Pontibacter pamirensis]